MSWDRKRWDKLVGDARRAAEPQEPRYTCVLDPVHAPWDSWPTTPWRANARGIYEQLRETQVAPEQPLNWEWLVEQAYSMARQRAEVLRLHALRHAYPEPYRWAEASAATWAAFQ